MEKIRCKEYKSAGLKKLKGYNLFRAEMGISERILFAKTRFQGESILLILEKISHHDHEYKRSKFLKNFSYYSSLLFRESLSHEDMLEYKVN